MMLRVFSIATLAFGALVAGPVLAQEKNESKPLLRLEAGGPTSNVTSLAFSPDGKTLYVAGFDKVLRTWKWDAAKSRFELDDTNSFRVPIGPGIDGAINALALSEDGQWLAVGGFGVVAEGMKFNEAGRLIPSKGGLTAAMRYERGQIFVFNTRDRSVKSLKGHSGPLLSLAFARNSKDNPRLISAAEGWDFQATQEIGEVKAWDVAKEKEIDTRNMPKLTFARRPGLAMFVTIENKLRAYLAWEDGTLLRWDLSESKATKMFSPKTNVALDLGPGNTKLAMTGMLEGNGILGAIDPEGFAGMGVHAMPRGGEKEFDLPLAVRYCGTNPNAAVIVRHFRNGVPTSDSLWLIPDLGNQWGQPAAKIRLGEGNRILPALAASNDHVAVGGFPDHRVVVFAIKDVVKGNAEPMVLRSNGATMRSVAFVKKGNDRGLAVSEKEGEAKGGLILDLSRGKLITATPEWLNDAASAGDYELVINLLKATLTKGNQTVSTVTVKEGLITASAVSPPLAQDVPLVAIASYIPIKGTTLLELFDGATGQTLRRYVGHTAPIRSLSFRADGKLLASAADDQTTIVWSLTDLGEVVGKHGSLGELAVELRGKDLVVLDATGVKNIIAGDVVRGLYDKTGKLQPLATSAAFYEGLWLKKPNQNVKLRIGRAGQELDIDVAVRQGVDVRKPLFSLFFPRDAAGKLGDWLGWNAIGPYDSSRRDVEQYLGWHFNTGKAEQPTSFAFIDQYRKEYFRPGLLKDMAELGDLPPPPKGPAPKMALLVSGIVEDGALLTSFGGEYLLRKKAFEIQVTIPAYEPFNGDELFYKIEGEAERPLPQADVNLWSAKVDVPAGGDPVRRVAIRMKRTPEGWPAQEYRSDVALRLVAPPPKIALDGPKNAEPIKVAKAEFAFKAGFQPGEAGVAYRASFAQESSGKKIATRELKSDKDGDLGATLTLEPGLNVIQVRAVNDRAFGRPHEDDEAATASIRVLYEPRKVPAPTIAFTHLAPGDAKVRTPIAGRTVKYQSLKGTVAVAYAIKSEEPIASLEYEIVPGQKRQPLALPADEAKRTLTVPLTPGLQTVRVFLKTDQGVSVTGEQEIDFRPPPLAQPVIGNLEEGFTVSGDGDRFDTPLDVRFAPLEADYKLPVTVEASVIVSGKTVGSEKVVVDASIGSVKFEKLSLAHGSNTIQVRLKHDFGGEDRVAEIHGRYVRPPKIASVSATPVGKTPFVDVKAEVVSQIKLSAEYVIVKVNGQAVLPSSIDIKNGLGDRTWIVEAKQVPLAVVKGKDAKSDIALSLATSDGEAKASLKEAVVFSLPLPPAPEITLLEPALREATLSNPSVRLRFKVSSEAPPSRVEIIRGDKLLKQWKEIQASADGVYEFSLPDVTLDWGLTAFRLLAANDGGVRTVPLNINVPPQPVRLELDHVEIAPAGLKVEPNEDGSFAPLAAGRVVLHGSVRWNPNDDAILQKAKQVRMFVNGYQQLPVELKPAVGESRERKFQVPVVLNFAKDNTVEIDLPEMKQDAANRRKFSLDCKQPVRGQHLHVLVIAPQEKDEAKLIESLTRGINAQPIGANLYKTPVFDVVRFYVLAKHVQLLEISSRLDRIAESLKERAKAGNPNDLVLIYFQGKETIDANGPILWTSESAPWLQLTLKDLSKNYLSRFSGGQVLLLDTISQAGAIEIGNTRYAYLRRSDPRPLADAGRQRFAAELEKQIPNVVWLDQLTTVLAAQIQSFLPEPLRNKIQLNPN